MDKFKEEIIKKGEESPIWLLEMRIARQNKLLLNLASQNTPLDDEHLKKVCYKRDIYRKILLKKLQDLENGKIKEDNPQYSDYIDYEKDKFNSGFYLTKK
jgi:hypothetical protein